MPVITVKIDEQYIARLRGRLADLGISLGALAWEMKVEPSQVSRWLKPDADPTVQTVVRIERAILELRKRPRAQRSGHRARHATQ